MAAALTGSDATVAALLARGARPDSTDDNGQTALVAAIQSGVSLTIALLAPVTNTGLGKALGFLARDQVSMSPPATRELVERAARDPETALEGLEWAVMWGAGEMVEILTQGWTSDSLNVQLAQKLLRDAVLSDCRKTCGAILALCQSVPVEVVELAVQRGMEDVFPGWQDDGEEKKEKMKHAIIGKTATILERLPKSREIAYCNPISQLVPLLPPSSSSPQTVPFSILLSALLQPEVHTIGQCPHDCPQTRACTRMREVLNLAKCILELVAREDKIFAGAKPQIVGSVKENSRLFSLDETDLYVSLPDVHKNYCQFNPEKQELRVTGIGQNYVRSNGKFNTHMYFTNYLTFVEHAINTINLADGYNDDDGQHHPFTMEPLSTSYHPCLPCMEISEGRAQARRCHHREDCQPHREGEGECRQGCKDVCEVFSHQKTCQCQEYTSPSLTR